jgi:cysteinyl-tRNA synthetase
LIALSQKQKPVACWMHVGILDIENAKMSKSAGNAIYIKELLKKYDVNTLKLYFYSHDYKRLLNFKISELEKFEEMNNMIRSLVFASDYSKGINGITYDTVKDTKESEILKKFRNYIEDLDTPNALKVFLDTVEDVDKMNDAKKMMDIFGLRY